jgi:hypothetical protein
VSTTSETVNPYVLDQRKNHDKARGRWRRTLLASSAALSLGVQDAAWATCLNGNTFPVGGFVVGSAQLPVASNWSPNVFTATAGSLFVPDNSVNEHNNPTKPLTGGGHKLGI